MSNEDEHRRELVENALACHARIRKSTEIIRVCLRTFSPATFEIILREVNFIEKKINQSQSELSELWNQSYWK